MKTSLMVKNIILTLSLLFMVACGSKDPIEPTLTFYKDGCGYDGPTTVTSKFNLTWVIEDSDHSAFIYGVVTLDKGKTVQDLSTIPAEGPPPAWVTKLTADFELSPGTYLKTVDFSANAIFNEGPIYIVCFFYDEDSAIGAVGPIDVQK